VRLISGSCARGECFQRAVDGEVEREFAVVA